MDNDHSNGSAVREHDRTSPEETWGAKSSLKKLRNQDRKINTDGASDEVTPLLSDGSGGSGSDVNGSIRELEWEGLRDFEGVPWWRKPSVS